MTIMDPRTAGLTNADAVKGSIVLFAAAQQTFI